MGEKNLRESERNSEREKEETEEREAREFQRVGRDSVREKKMKMKNIYI